MDTSGISGLSGAALALHYEVSVAKLAQDQQKQDGAGVLRLIEGAALAAAPERPDGKGALVDVVA